MTRGYYIDRINWLAAGLDEDELRRLAEEADRMAGARRAPLPPLTGSRAAGGLGDSAGLR